MRKSIVCIKAVIFIFWILAAPSPKVCADSPAGIVDKGNAAYLSGKYDDAISAYEEASVEAPESPHIYFNKGAAFYKKGDYASAAEAFEKAAVKSKDITLEAKSRFNLGNCAYREAERQQDSDLDKALEACTKSIRHYQEALELDPDFNEAAENIEVVRLVMKTILDEINKQKEAAKQQQEAMQRTAEQLKELIKKQQEALNRNQQFMDERRQKGDSDSLHDKIQDLAQDQKNLQAETEDLAKNMPKPGGQNAPPAESATEKHLKNAALSYHRMSGKLLQGEKSSREIAPYPMSLQNDEKWTKEMRREQIKRLEEAQSLEVLAIDEIEKALSSINV